AFFGDDTERGTAVTYGLGAHLRFFSLALRLGYDRFELDRDPIDTGPHGLTHPFFRRTSHAHAWRETSATGAHASPCRHARRRRHAHRPANQRIYLATRAWPARRGHRQANFLAA